MGYQHIDNLYKYPQLLQCYALEKVHGTSAHITFRREGGTPSIMFSSGGIKYETFKALFDETHLLTVFNEKFPNDGSVILYGEAYGGKCQKMSATYGPDLKFSVFEAKIDDMWLNVPSAEGLTQSFGLDFVPYEVGPLTLDFLNQERDRDSLVAVVPGKIREGIVVRPMQESTFNNGKRSIFKHKRAEFCETKTPREVNPEQAVVLADAQAVADEWVTPMRLEHVLQKTPFEQDSDTGKVIKAMIEDVRRESEGEVVWSKEVEKAVSRATAKLLHASQLQELITSKGA